MLVSICLTLLNNVLLDLDCMKKTIPELVEDSLVVVMQLNFLHTTPVTLQVCGSYWIPKRINRCC